MEKTLQNIPEKPDTCKAGCSTEKVEMHGHSVDVPRSQGVHRSLLIVEPKFRPISKGLEFDSGNAGELGGSVGPRSNPLGASIGRDTCTTMSRRYPRRKELESVRFNACFRGNLEQIMKS